MRHRHAFLHEGVRLGHQSVSWDHYRAFLAVAETGSLSAAGRRLGLTQPTLGRQIAALELSLGLSLFVRSPAGLTLTEAGEDLLPDARGMAAAAEALMRSASGGRDETSGVVRITASEVIGGMVLPGMLAELQAQHPALVVELALTNRSEDLLRRDADIAVRMVRPEQNAIVAAHIGRVSLGLYAHESYLARSGTPSSASELMDHAMIGFDRDDAAARALGVTDVWNRRAFRFRTDSDLAQLAALRAGCGIGVCQAPLAAQWPELRPVMADVARFELDMWLAMHEDQRRSRRIRVTFNHLAAHLRSYVNRHR
jgi:DNA-binding transcriptional LysR family regulator